MSHPTAWFEQVLVRELDGFEREIALCPDDAALWRTAPGVSNALGTLVLHVCGNLQFFLGSVLGQTGYVRDREREFSARGVPRDELLRQLQSTKTVVRTVLADVTDDVLAREYPEAVGGVTMGTGVFLTHLCAHLAFHLGQAGYLRRVLTGAEARSAGPLPLKPLTAQR